MTEQKMPRVMWLLNHSSARKFEIPMLHSIGVKEIFLPKRYPNDPNFRSASVDISEDKNLTIPKEDLDILNAADWYGATDPEAWEIANRYFDIAFLIFLNGDIIKRVAKYFKGIALWRTFGIAGRMTYTKILTELPRFERASTQLASMGKRFYFAEAYDHLHKVEGDFIKRHHVYLPLGLPGASAGINDKWTGKRESVFFVCPDLRANPAYEEIYQEFVDNFGDFPYVIAGTQSVYVPDQRVLGYVSREEHEQNMREMRVMFYHSHESNHIHFHPFEAVLAGMPLVFMAGGMLDRMGGRKLPGRCSTIKEARRKLHRILNNDKRLINDIRRTQGCLLEAMMPENCEQAWRDGLRLILETLAKIKAEPLCFRPKIPRIAILASTNEYSDEYNAQLLASAVERGAHRAGEKVEIVFGYVKNKHDATNKNFPGLSTAVAVRPFQWRTLSEEEARRAMVYAGDERLLPTRNYLVADDGINQFIDCDAWFVTSDQLNSSLLPIRPYVLLTDGYLQRYEPCISQERNYHHINIARAAECVLASSSFAKQAVIQFAGVPERRVTQVSLNIGISEIQRPSISFERTPTYFIWPTNVEAYKNHENALRALSLYYEMYEGTLECHVIGVDLKELLRRNRRIFRTLRQIFDANPTLRKHVNFLGKLSSVAFRKQLVEASFLWHPSRIDNDIGNVIYATRHCVPVLAGDFPALKEADTQLRLNIAWTNVEDIEIMAKRLKIMETESVNISNSLLDRNHLADEFIEQSSDTCWQAAQECL